MGTVDLPDVGKIDLPCGYSGGWISADPPFKIGTAKVLVDMDLQNGLDGGHETPCVRGCPNLL